MVRKSRVDPLQSKLPWAPARKLNDPERSRKPTVVDCRPNRSGLVTKDKLKAFFRSNSEKRKDKTISFELCEDPVFDEDDEEVDSPKQSKIQKKNDSLEQQELQSSISDSSDDGEFVYNNSRILLAHPDSDSDFEETKPTKLPLLSRPDQSTSLMPISGPSSALVTSSVSSSSSSVASKSTRRNPVKRSQTRSVVGEPHALWQKKKTTSPKQHQTIKNQFKGIKSSSLSVLDSSDSWGSYEASRGRRYRGENDQKKRVSSDGDLIGDSKHKKSEDDDDDVVVISPRMVNIVKKQQRAFNVQQAVLRTSSSPKQDTTNSQLKTHSHENNHIDHDNNDDDDDDGFVTHRSSSQNKKRRSIQPDSDEEDYKSDSSDVLAVSRSMRKKQFSNSKLKNSDSEEDEVEETSWRRKCKAHTVEYDEYDEYDDDDDHEEEEEEESDHDEYASHRACMMAMERERNESFMSNLDHMSASTVPINNNEHKFSAFIELLARVAQSNGEFLAHSGSGRHRGMVEAGEQVASGLCTMVESQFGTMAWKGEFREDVRAYPYVRVQRAVTSRSGDQTCGACGRTHSVSHVFTLGGQPYDAFTFQNSSRWDRGVDENSIAKFSAERPGTVSYYLGSTCRMKAQLYHTGWHFKYRLFKRVRERVGSVYEGVLSDFLGDSSTAADAWKSKQLKKYNSYIKLTKNHDMGQRRSSLGDGWELWSTHSEFDDDDNDDVEEEEEDDDDDEGEYQYEDVNRSNKRKSFTKRCYGSSKFSAWLEE